MGLAEECALQRCDADEHELVPNAAWGFGFVCQHCRRDELQLVRARNKTRMAGEKGGGSGFRYMIFQGGDRDVFEPDREIGCPYGRARISSRVILERDIDAIWVSHVSPGNEDRVATETNNVRKILVGVLSAEDVCSYHLARAVVAALFEVRSGFAGDEYGLLAPALRALVRRAFVNPPREYVEQAVVWLDLYLGAAAGGYFHQFDRAADRTRRDVAEVLA
jgi:hypothetical protein